MKPEKITVSFKSVEAKDDKGNPIPAMKEIKDETTGVVTSVPERDKAGKPVMQRITKAPIVIETSVFDSMDDIVAILSIEDEAQRDKQVKLLLGQMNLAIEDQIKALVKEDETKVRENGIPAEQLTWQFLANMPEKERKGAAIADEVWEKFEKDYVEVIVHHGVPLDNAKMGAKLLANRFYAVKTNKKVIAGLQKRLATWWQNSELKGEADMQAVYELLQTRAETLLQADEDQLVAAI